MLLKMNVTVILNSISNFYVLSLTLLLRKIAIAIDGRGCISV